MKLSLKKFFPKDMTEANTLSAGEGTTVGIYVTGETPSSDYSAVLFGLYKPPKTLYH